MNNRSFRKPDLNLKLLSLYYINVSNDDDNDADIHLSSRIELSNNGKFPPHEN